MCGVCDRIREFLKGVEREKIEICGGGRFCECIGNELQSCQKWRNC